jgi:capsular exopolysaccharide synthesis family protein
VVLGTRRPKIPGILPADFQRRERVGAPTRHSYNHRLSVTNVQLERDLSHYSKLIWRWKWLLLAVIILIPAGVYVVSSNLPKSYEATTTLHVQPTNASSVLSAQVAVSTSTAEGAARLIETTVVAEQAAKKLGESRASARSLLDGVNAEVDDDQSPQPEFLTITARAGSPRRAADVANAFAAAIATTRAQDAIKAIDQTIEKLTTEADEINASDQTARVQLDQQLQELQVLRATQADTMQVVEPAVAPSAPISPRPARNGALALLFSTLLAGALIPVLDRLDRRLRDTAELEELVGASLLAMIPTAAFSDRGAEPHVREAFQTLRASVTYFNIDDPPRSVIVTSPQQGDGKTTVAANLAVALARDERNVILIDGDLRRPQLAERLGASVHIGLDALLMGERKLADTLVEVEVGGGRLRLLPGGSPSNPSALVGSKRMRSMLRALSDQVDMVIIDTPAILAVSDAVPLLEQVSGVVLVARMDYTSREALLRARHVISTAGGRMLGVVATATRAGGYGYDGYGYGEILEERPAVAGHRQRSQPR